MKFTRKKLRKIIKESFKSSFPHSEQDNIRDQLSNILGIGDIRDHETSYFHHEENEHHAHFVNELGNNIEIGVKDYGCGSANQLTISIIGPNSETENTSTRMEAEELHRLLGNYLSNTNASLE